MDDIITEFSKINHLNIQQDNITVMYNPISIIYIPTLIILYTFTRISVAKRSKYSPSKSMLVTDLIRYAHLETQVMLETLKVLYWNQA